MDDLARDSYSSADSDSRFDSDFADSDFADSDFADSDFADTVLSTGRPFAPEADALLRRLRAGQLLGVPEASPGRPGERTESPPEDPPTRVEDARPSSRWRGLVWDRIPIGLRGAAVDPTLRGAVGLAVLALVAALIALGLVWRGAPRPVAVPEAPAVVGAPAGAAPGSTASASPSPPATAAGLVVDVAGKVRRPGVVTLPAGARVADALRSAGGVLPGTDTSALSLARKLVDGEQVLVTGRPGPPAAAPSGGAAGSGDTATAGSGGAASGTSGADPSSAGPLDLNAATVEQLDGLPGVGPVLAGRIIEWRTAHNGFASVDQLREVKGLGGKTGTELLPLVRVG